MIYIRSTLFFILFIIWNLLCCITGLLVSVKRKWLLYVAKIWSRGIIFLLGKITKIIIEVEGLENLPTKGEGCIIASKHQSALETLVLYDIIEGVGFVFKKELMYIPLFGWNIYLSGSVMVDRGAGKKAMQSVLKKVPERVNEGRKIVIFPEGTRVKPGENTPYKPAVYGIYKQGVKTFPMVLNSGVFWPKGGFIKKPGIVKLKIFPEINQGLEKKDFMSQLHETLEVEALKILPKEFDKS